MRVQRLPAQGEPVRDHSGNEPRDELDGLLQGGAAPRADIRVAHVHAVGAAQLVLRRLPVGQLPRVRARVPVRQQEAAGVEHGHLVAAVRSHAARGHGVRRARHGGHPDRAGPDLRVHVPHGARHNGQVVAAARAQPARRLHHQRHTAGHHGHARAVRRPVQQRSGMAGRVLRERHHRARVDGRLATAGRRVARHAPVHRPAREGLHTSVAGKHHRPRFESEYPHVTPYVPTRTAEECALQAEIQ